MTTTTILTSFTIDQLQKIVFELLTQLSQEPSTSENAEKNSIEGNTRVLLKHLKQILEKRIDLLSGEKDCDVFEDEWVVLVWSILNLLARISADSEPETVQGLNHYLVALVNQAKPIRIPRLHPNGEKHWAIFHQSFNNTLHLMHDLYSQLDNLNLNFEPKLVSFCDRQLEPCLDAFRQMCRHHAATMHTNLRSTQVTRMREMSKLVDADFEPVTSHYTSCLYILGLLAARLQGFRYECNTLAQSYYLDLSSTMERMMRMVLVTYDQLLNDGLVSIEPSSSSILVTNNLFTFSCSTLSKTLIFRKFDVQIVSEDTALAIQEEIKKVRAGQSDAAHPMKFASAALLAIKPTSGVKRNNATANASGEGGNTAHKKSDVNSRESVCLQPSYSEKYHSWQAQYPHLLCTTRQKDTVLLDSRTGPIGKRPLFYFHTCAKSFSPTGGVFHVRTLSLPFTIATRRNQDCQVQRMMSSYTATCFWLYGTCSVDGLLLNWNEVALPWKQFRKLCSQYFTVNAEVKRPIAENDFDILQEKMQCEDCEEYVNSRKASEDRLITFKNMLCPHLRFETETSQMRFSVWRGILEVLQIFQEQKANTKILWDNFLMHGFLDIDTAINLLLPKNSCMLVRLTYILGGSICVSYKTASGELVHLEPIELKKLQTKSVLDYLADIAESAKIDYLLTAQTELISFDEIVKKYKIGDEVKGIRSVVSNVSHSGSVDLMNNVKFTPLRVAVVACREPQIASNLPPSVPPVCTTPSNPNKYLGAMRHTRNGGGGVVQRAAASLSTTPSPSGAPPSVVVMASPPVVSTPNPPPIPQVSFEVQLETLMKMYGKTPVEVCDMFAYGSPIPPHNDIYHQHHHPVAPIHNSHHHPPPTLNPYLDNPPTYEYC